MAHIDLSTIKTEEDITDELLANDEEHKGHNKTRLLISQKKVEFLKYQAEHYRQLSLITLKKGEVCSLSNLVEFNKAQIELSAELQYQELLSMELFPRIQMMRKLAAQLENVHQHSKQEKSPTPPTTETQYVKRQTIKSKEDDGPTGIIPISKKPVGKKTVNM